MISLTWSTDENDWIVLGDPYNEYFNNWKGTINNGQFLHNNIKEMIKTEEICSKYAGSVKFNGIPRKENQVKNKLVQFFDSDCGLTTLFRSPSRVK